MNRRVVGSALGAALALSLLAASPHAGAAATSGPTPSAVAVSTVDEDQHSHAFDHRLLLPPQTRDGRPQWVTERVAARRIRKWPGRTIKYWVDAPRSFAWAIQKGVEAWNRTGLDMRFVRTSRARSQLTIRTVANLRGSLGLATVGYSPARNWRWVKLDARQLGNRFWPGFTMSEKRVLTARVVAHELGHTLGLNHRNTRCELMGPTIFGGSCPYFAPKVGHYNCRVVPLTDLRRAIRLYGGRRSLAPTSCPLDALPRSLSGIAFSGGGPSAAPGLATWRPASAPTGTAAQVLVDTGSSTTCNFKPVASLKRMARYPRDVKVNRIRPSVGRFSITTNVNERRVCLRVSSANASGADAGPRTGYLTLYVPQPPPPTVHWVRQPYSNRGGGVYAAKVDLPAGHLDDPLYYKVGAEGVCPATFSEAGWDQATEWESRFEIDDLNNRVRPCVSFTMLDRGRASAIVSFQVGSEPPPAAPVVDAVQRLPDGGYRFRPPTGVTYDHDVLALVGADGVCPPRTWSTDHDPWDYLAYPGGNGWFDVYENVPRGCVTVYQIDGLGQVGLGTQKQTPPAPAPVTPTISDETISSPDTWTYRIRFRAVFDESKFQLVARTAPDGQCPTDPPAEGEEQEPWFDGVKWELDYWKSTSNEPRPCVAVYTRNADNVYSAPWVKDF